jgi:hypothetical protein
MPNAYDARPENIERAKKRRRLYLEHDPAYRVNERLLTGYKLTPEQYEELQKQFPRCAICGAKRDGIRYGKLHVDHNHGTGEIRGLLCPNCNRGLGLFQDNPGILQMAIDYLTTP